MDIFGAQKRVEQSDQQRRRRYTNDEKRQIADRHLGLHEGQARPSKFVQEARDVTHPAHDWFEWDDAVAGEKYRRHQAREFFSSIKVDYVLEYAGEAESVGQHPYLVHCVQSSGEEDVDYDRGLGTSRSGEGYVPFISPDGPALLQREFLMWLRQGMNRYSAVMVKEVRGLLGKAAVIVHEERAKKDGVAG